MNSDKSAGEGLLTVIFDTNIFIYADRGVENAKDLLLTTPDRAISAVTYMEYVPFCRNKRELAIFDQLLRSLQVAIYDVSTEISMLARKLVQQFALSHSVEMGDALIAATALTYSETLCTGNDKHFKPVNGLVIQPFRP